jgi:hypothetical protein
MLGESDGLGGVPFPTGLFQGGSTRRVVSVGEAFTFADSLRTQHARVLVDKDDLINYQLVIRVAAMNC